MQPLAYKRRLASSVGCFPIVWKTIPSGSTAPTGWGQQVCPSADVSAFRSRRGPILSQAQSDLPLPAPDADGEARPAQAITKPLPIGDLSIAGSAAI